MSSARHHEDDTPFARLTPDAVLDAAEALGFGPDGHLFALNSYENRVYRLGRIDQDPVVLKFYRAKRWSDAQILEEHSFAAELAAMELPVAAPLRLNGATLHRHQSFRLAAFPLCPGTAPELDQPGARELLGRTLARIHAIGAQRRFQQRPSLAGPQAAARARQLLLSSSLLPAHMHEACSRASAALLAGIDASFAAAAPVALIRLHGDCHLGNILWRQTGPMFVDLDDCMNGPRMQDLWMFLSGSAPEQQRQWLDIMEGYRQFGTLEMAEVRLIEALRATRMLHHAAWIAERWTDPAFPRAFPWAGEARFWEGYVGDLWQQGEQLEDPPLLALLMVPVLALEPVLMSAAMAIDRQQGLPGAGRRAAGCALVAAVALLWLAGCGAASAPQTQQAPAQQASVSASSGAADAAGADGAPDADGGATDPSADMVNAVSPAGSAASINVKFRLETRPVVGMPVKILVAVIPTADAQINRIHGSFLVGEGLQLQADHSFDVSEVHAGTPVYHEVTVVPQQAGVLSLSATILLDTDKNTETRTYSIPLIATDSSS